MSSHQYVTALHGNEPLPTLALASQGVEQVVGNPQALALNSRYVDKDLNAAFKTGGKTYEERRAREVLEQLDERPVIDFHTFSAESPPFAIIVDMNMLSLAQSLGLKRIVYMKHNVKSGHALIDQVSGVSVEVGRHDDPASFELTFELVRRLNNPKPTQNQKLYEVYAIIEEAGDYENFTCHKRGFFPVLAGENAYDHYGLKAKFKEDL